MDEQLLKYFQEKLNTSEQLKLLRKVSTDEELKKQYIKLQNLHGMLDLSILPPGENKETIHLNYIKLLKRVQKQKTRKIVLTVMGYAAAIAFLIISTWWVADSAKYSGTNTLRVPAGQRACITLQDGTEVWVNAHSTLTYPSQFNGKERFVTLCGEAFFHIAPNPSQPFIVSTKDTKIEALGTQFNVKSYPESDFVQTSLLEGSVRITNLKPEKKNIILYPSQEVIVRNGKMDVKEIEHLSYFLWKDGIYSFEEEEFKSIIQKLEFYYDVKIVVKDSSILDLVYTGKFRQQDGVDEILRIFQKIQKFNIKKDREHHIITLSK